MEYTLGRDDDTVYRLITTICNPQEASAADLAGLYHQRWEIENTLDEIKTHQGGHRLVLRPQYPDGVEQEIYGFLLVHHALRDVMHHTARTRLVPPSACAFCLATAADWTARAAAGQLLYGPATARAVTPAMLRAQDLPPRSRCRGGHGAWPLHGA
ncbi:transposase [Streptomyces sp. NPDC087532]|uniref:transposase n=1 Tax=Streptomyces sp. NPDC087532 TaxID=3365795 RepID=UPI0038082712